MKVLVSVTGTDLSAEVDPRFGRAAHFLLVETDTLAYEVVENEQNLNMPQGAGVQAGKIAADCGAEVVITGNCGPKAFSVLQKAGIEVVIGARGTVSEAIAAYQNGKLQSTTNANVDGHWV